MSTLVTTPSSAERFAAHGPVAARVAVSPAATGAATGGSSIASLMARLAAAWRQRREEAAYEAALRRDPRLMHDLRLAKSRAEWR